MKGLYVKSLKINNIQKGHFHIDTDAWTDKVFMLLDAVQGDNKDKIDELMNDFDMEFIALAEMKLTDNLTIQAMWVLGD